MSSSTTTPAGVAVPDADRPSASPAPGAGSRLSMFSGLLWDVGGPLVGYYALHLLGADDLVALSVAAGVAALRLVVVAARARRVTWFAVVMLAVFGIGLVLALVGGDARFLLLKESITTGAVGVVFLASLLGAKPLTLSAFQSWQPGRAVEMEEHFRTIPPVRRSFRRSTAVWGVGLIADALVRLPVVLTLPVDVAVGVSTGMLVAVIGVLAVWNVAEGKRAGARAEAWLAGEDGPAGALS